MSKTQKITTVVMNLNRALKNEVNLLTVVATSQKIQLTQAQNIKSIIRDAGKGKKKPVACQEELNNIPPAVITNKEATKSIGVTLYIKAKNRKFVDLITLCNKKAITKLKITRDTASTKVTDTEPIKFTKMKSRPPQIKSL